MRRMPRALSLALTWLAGVAGAAIVLLVIWLAGYHMRKSTDNLPALNLIPELNEAEVTGLIQGYRRVQLTVVWGDADQDVTGPDAWTLPDGRVLFVEYNKNDVAVRVRLLDPSGQQEGDASLGPPEGQAPAP